MSRIRLESWTIAEELLRLSYSGNILMYGPKGTGKSTFAQVRTPGSNRQCYSVTCTDEGSFADLFGHFIRGASGAYEWNQGPAYRAWVNGGVLALNEIDKAGPDMETGLHVCLDDPEFASLTLANGETIKPEEGFQVVATMNGEPGNLDEALLDRFAVRLLISSPHADAIKSLPSHLQGFVKNAYSDPINNPISFREVKAFGQMERLIGSNAAAFAVWGDDLGTQILDMIKLARAEGGRE